jgi:erythronate-4-phosphate dehydrogenase
MNFIVDSKNPFLAEALRPYGDTRELATPLITRETLRRADAVIVRSETRVNASLLDGTAVRFVGTATIGTDHVDLGYLRERGIGFASAPGSNANSVAEYVAAALLETAARRRMRLAGTTLGVVGIGNVGSRVVHVGRALGMEVLQNDPPRARATGDRAFVPLDALMQADVISVHVPLTDAGPDRTHHLFDRKRLSRMKPGAVLINSSRGAVVETPALQSALAQRHLGGAILDVWEGEPDISAGLLAQVLIGTPHIAGYSFDGKVNAARKMFEAIVLHFNIPARWLTREDMPAPRTDCITFAGGEELQAALADAVRRCYDIIADDARLRTLLDLPPDARPGEFRVQRSTYPVRREFHATRIECAGTTPGLQEALTSLGFLV